MTDDYSLALGYIQQAESLFDSVLKSVLQALADDRVQPMEYLMIGMTGSNAGIAAYTLFRALPAADRQKLRYVLLHGQRTWTLPEEPTHP
jgi:hypothetical protein